MQQIITMPAGQNTLTVKTIDVNGKQKTETQTFKLDVDKPNISLSVIGNKIKIAVDSKADLGYIARSYRDVPDEDGLVFIETPKEHRAGDIVLAKVTNAEEYDLIAEEI